MPAPVFTSDPPVPEIVPEKVVLVPRAPIVTVRLPSVSAPPPAREPMVTSANCPLIKPVAAFVIVAFAAEAASRKSRVALFVMLAEPADDVPPNTIDPLLVMVALPAVAVSQMLRAP
ncbi:MAG: hypothetical protein WCC69_09840 [Pirellulales bacterium]